MPVCSIHSAARVEQNEAKAILTAVRVLLHWNTSLPQSEVKHVYLGDAASLRPDLTRTQ